MLRLVYIRVFNKLMAGKLFMFTYPVYGILCPA